MGEWIISSSVLIVLLIVLRYFFRKRLAMRVWYALWLVVAVRLLVPVSFSESSLSVMNLFEFAGSEDSQETEADPEAERTGRNDVASGLYAEESSVSGPVEMTGMAAEKSGMVAEQSGMSAQGMGMPEETGVAAGGKDHKAEAELLSGTADVNGQEPLTQGLSAAADNRSAGRKPGEERAAGGGRGREFLSACGTAFAGHSVLWHIWFLGVLLSVGGTFWLNGKYRKRVRRSRKRYGAETGSRLPVYVSAVVDSPCMFGLIHPAVYLSREAAQESAALRYVLCHENIHYRHHDNLWVVVRAACLCLHWYNPLVWMAAALSEQDGELACDERTLEILGQEERIRYGRALLDFSAQGSVWQRGWKLSIAMSSGKKLLKERLQVIVGEPKRQAGALVLVMVLTAFFTAATFTGKVDGRELETDGAPGESGDVFSADNSLDSPAESTAIRPVDLGDGREYTLKIVGEAVSGNGEYRIDRIELNWVHDRMEDTLQTILPEDVRVLYTRSLEDIRNGNGQMYYYALEGEPLYAKPLYTEEDLLAHEVEKFLADENREMYSDAPDGSVVVADLNFDGYQDFCVQAGTGTVNIPYYCYLWNPQGERFEPGYMIPNVEVDSEAQLIKSATDDGNGQHSVKYYRFDEANILHMVRYVEEKQSPDAVFPTLDLTYCEPYYALPAVDEWDYGTRYGGALTERFVYWAKEALTELYEWSGTKIDKACFTVTRFGDFCFANTPEELQSSLIYYDRVYGEDAGFESCVKQMGVATERTVWFSPVIQWNKPENLDEMTDHELAEWYFERAPLAEGEKLVSVEGIGEGIGYDTYSILNILAESGNFYQIYLNGATREMSAMYGPYEERPD